MFDNACWYRCRASSNDLAALANGVAVAMERVVPGLAEQISHQLARAPAQEHEASLLASLIVTATNVVDFALVIDDY